MRSLWPYLRRLLAERRALLAGYVCLPLAQLSDIAISWMLGGALDGLRQGGTTALWSVLFWVLALAASRGFLRFGQRLFIERAGRLFERGLRGELFGHLARLGPAFRRQHPAGELTSRLATDVESVRMFLAPGLMYAMGSLFMLPVCLVLLATLHSKLTLLLVLPFGIMGIFVRLAHPRVYRISRHAQDTLAKLGQGAQESMNGLGVIRGYGVEQQSSKSFTTLAQTTRDAQVAFAEARGLTHAVTHVSNQLSFLAILGLGGLAMMRGELTVGGLFRFIDLALKVFWPVIAIGWLAGLWPRAQAAADRLTELLSAKPELVEGDANAPSDLSLTWERVSVRHAEAEAPSLTDISFSLAAGSSLAVVGPTGCGKTTLLEALARIRPCEGRFELGGIEVDALASSEYHRLLAYAPQDGWLFSDTWRANVELGAGRALHQERLAELAEAVHLREEIEALPQGYETLLGERGVMLSGGQRQRTALARALAAERPILILDDVSSAVDTTTEAHLLQTLREAGVQRTVVLSTHRLRAAEDCEAVLVLTPGGQAEVLGTHAEALEKSPWYAQVYALQSALEERGA